VVNVAAMSPPGCHCEEAQPTKQSKNEIAAHPAVLATTEICPCLEYKSGFGAIWYMRVYEGICGYMRVYEGI